MIIPKKLLPALAATLLLCQGARAERAVTVEEAVEIAVSNNPGLRAARADVDISKAALRQVRAPLYPQVSGKVVVPFVGRESGFYVDQMIWDFGKTTSRIRAKKHYLESSRHELSGARGALERDTRAAYYEALSARSRIPEAETEASRRGWLLEKTEELFAVGKKSPQELNRAKLDLRGARLELVSRKNSFELSMLNLRNMMNDPEIGEFELVEDLSREEVARTREELVAAALSRNPRIKSLEARRAGLNASLGEARGKFLPSIFGRAAYRFKGEGAYTPALIAGVGVKIPIFEGLRRFGETSQSRAKIARNEAETEVLRSRIALSVGELYLRLRHLEEETRILEESKVISRKNLSVAKERHAARSASKIELAEARALYRKAVSDYKISVYEYKTARLRLLGMCGEPAQ